MLKNIFNLGRSFLQHSVLKRYADLLMSACGEDKNIRSQCLLLVYKKVLHSWSSKIILAWLPYEINSKIPICFHQKQIRVLMPQFENSCEEH